MTEFIIGALGLGCLSVTIFACMMLVRVTRRRENENNNPKGVVYDLKGDIVTQLPLPIGAATCTHSWDVITNEKLETEHEVRSVTILKCDGCGAIDKTVEVTNEAPKPPQPVVPVSECRHNWKKQRSVTLDSAYEQQTSAVNKFNGSYNNRSKKAKDFPQIDEQEPWMFRKTFIETRICSKCGKINTVQASNFETEDQDGTS